MIFPEGQPVSFFPDTKNLPCQQSWEHMEKLKQKEETRQNADT